ncbi:hypothetical protein D3C71_2196080 [compost metagenome]
MQTCRLQARHPRLIKQLMVQVNRHAAQPGGQLAPVLTPLVQQQPARQLRHRLLRRFQGVNFKR